MLSIWFKIGLEVLAALIIALALRRWVCLLALVKGRSMLDSLRDGEVLFALRRRAGHEIRRFDVVLCRYPNRKELFVKRVIGLPGETISMADDTVFIDGEALTEDFPRRRCLRKIEETTLGTGEYFVIGDNRPVSRDSRSNLVGPIPEDKIVAVVRCVVFPPHRIRRI